MAGMRIDTGPVTAELHLRDVPPNLWPRLVKARRDHMDANLTHDCRCLARFVRDAEQMWQSLGYESHDDMLSRGYELEADEVKAAALWLDRNSPDDAIGLDAVLAMTTKERNQGAAKATTGKDVLSKGQPKKEMPKFGISQIDRAKAAGISRYQQQKQDKLARERPKLFEEVQQGRKTTNQAYIEAGFAKTLTPYEQVAKLVPKLTAAERAKLRKLLDR